MKKQSNHLLVDIGFPTFVHAVSRDAVSVLFAIQAVVNNGWNKAHLDSKIAELESSMESLKREIEKYKKGGAM